MELAGVGEEADSGPLAAVDTAAGDTAVVGRRAGAVAAAQGIADVVAVAEADRLAVVEDIGPAGHAEWPSQGYRWPGGWWLEPEVEGEVG